MITRACGRFCFNRLTSYVQISNIYQKHVALRRNGEIFKKYIFFGDSEVETCQYPDYLEIWCRKIKITGKKNEISKKSLRHGIKKYQIHNLAKF